MVDIEPRADLAAASLDERMHAAYKELDAVGREAAVEGKKILADLQELVALKIPEYPGNRFRDQSRTAFRKFISTEDALGDDNILEVHGSRKSLLLTPRSVYDQNSYEEHFGLRYEGDTVGISYRSSGFFLNEGEAPHNIVIRSNGTKLQINTMRGTSLLVNPHPNKPVLKIARRLVDVFRTASPFPMTPQVARKIAALPQASSVL